MAPNVVWFEKNGPQRLENHMKNAFQRFPRRENVWEPGLQSRSQSPQPSILPGAGAGAQI